MSRVDRSDPNSRDKSEDETQRQRPREFQDRTPGKAEGDEDTVNEALRHQDEEGKGARR